MARAVQLPVLFLGLAVSASTPDLSSEYTPTLFLQNTMVSPDFPVLCEALAHFDYENKKIHVWESSSNDQAFSPSQWKFRYEPLSVPVAGKNSRLIINVQKSDENWLSSFGVTLDDDQANNLALISVELALPETLGIHPKNIFSYPLSNFTLDMTDLIDHFPGAQLVGEFSCSETSACSDYPGISFRVVISSPTFKIAQEIAETFRGSRFSFDIRSSMTITESLKNIDTTARKKSEDAISETSESLKKLSSTIDGLHISVLKDIQKLPKFVKDSVEKLSHHNKKLLEAPPAAVKFSERTCEHSWTKACHSKVCHCYRVSADKANWTTSEENCKSFGANLASIHEFDEMPTMGNLVAAAREKGFWVGLNDQAVEGKFEWSDGTPTDFSAWATPYQPDNWLDNEDCVLVWLPHYYHYNGPPIYSWNDFDCGNVEMSVCQKKI